MQASVSHADVAAVTAIFLTVLEIGGAVGSAISGAVWTAKIPEKLALYLPDNAKADAALIFGNLTMATSYAAGSPERVAINRSYQETMDILLIIAACLAVPLLPLSLVMRNWRLAEVCACLPYFCPLFDVEFVCGFCVEQCMQRQKYLDHKKRGEEGYKMLLQKKI